MNDESNFESKLSTTVMCDHIYNNTKTDTTVKLGSSFEIIYPFCTVILYFYYPQDKKGDQSGVLSGSDPIHRDVVKIIKLFA